MKKMTKAMLMTALILGSVQWGGTAVHAEELNTFALDEYVVTATRYEKRDVDIAASVEVFDQERLQATGASNLYEAMQYGTGLMIHQYGTGGSSMGNMTSKVAIRGNTNGTLVLVNGMPINIRGTYDLNDIPVENVERVEVVRGGGSVLYGSDATGGVINIITKKERQNFVKAAVGNYGQQEYVASVQADKLGLSYKYSKWGSVDDMGWNKTDKLFDRSWKGPENNNFDLTYKFNDNLSLMASHNESTYHYLTTFTKSTKMGFTPANDTKQDVKRNNIQLTYQDEGFKATAYYIDRDREKYGNLLEDGRFYNHDDEMSKNYGLDIQKAIDLKDATFLIGATYQSENYKSEEESQAYKYESDTSTKIVKDPSEGGVEGYTTDSTKGNQSRDNYSIYMQYDKKLSKANSIILSARESWTNNSPTGDEFDNFSGQVQFIHKLNDNESFYASAGQSFKMPTLYQNYRNQGADLEPQEGTHYEIGWKKDIDENRSLRVALFDYEIENNISAKANENTHEWEYTNENIKNTGIEAEYVLASIKGFGYNVSVSYGNPKTQNIDKNNYDFGWQEDNNKFELKAGLTYRMDKWKAGLNAAYVAGRHGFSTTSASKKVKEPYVTNFDAKAYLLTNLNIEYQAQKDLSFFATINNIFDRDDVVFYSSSAEYYCTPFNFLIGMKYSF